MDLNLGTPEALDALDSIGSNYGSNPNSPLSVKQQTENKLIGMISNPWDAVKSNYERVKADFTDPSKGGWGMTGIGNKASDINKLIGTNYADTMLPSNFSAPKLTDAHLGEKDANGLRPINESGFKHIDSHASGMQIPDNTHFTAPVRKDSQPLPEPPNGVQNPASNTQGSFDPEKAQAAYSAVKSLF